MSVSILILCFGCLASFIGFYVYNQQRRAYAADKVNNSKPNLVILILSIIGLVGLVPLAATLIAIRYKEHKKKYADLEAEYSFGY